MSATGGDPPTRGGVSSFLPLATLDAVVTGGVPPRRSIQPGGGWDKPGRLRGVSDPPSP